MKNAGEVEIALYIKDKIISTADISRILNVNSTHSTPAGKYKTKEGPKPKENIWRIYEGPEEISRIRELWESLYSHILGKTTVFNEQLSASSKEIHVILYSNSPLDDVLIPGELINFTKLIRSELKIYFYDDRS